MSVRKLTYLACDGHDDDGPCVWLTDPVDGVEEARSLAHRLGWTRPKVDGRLVDLCPHCSRTCEDFCHGTLPPLDLTKEED